MTRARCVFGSSALRGQFDAIRTDVLSSHRHAEQLRAEVVAMREKLYAAYPAAAEQFDIKHSKGGMMDAEFAVQYLILAHAKDHPALLGNVGTIELLRIADVQQLLPAGVGAHAADAYQVLRDKQHAARLQEQKAWLPDGELKAERAAIITLWQATFDHS
jgi:glutamate-ammonia-ligase adenylyltransferase